MRTSGRRAGQRRAIARWVVGIVLTACAAGAAKADPHRVALVVGIGAYQHLPALPNTVADARLIADKLRATGFEVDLETDLGKDALARVVRDFAHKVEAAGPGAVSAFYYAGHGVQDDRQTNFLLGADADVKSQVDLPFEALPLDRTLETLEAAHPSVTLVMLDACRDNPLPASSRGVKRGLAVEAERRGLLIAFSTEPGKTADDGPPGGHSPFASALAAELDAPGVEVTTFFKQVTRKVLDDTHSEQFPWVTQRLVDDFYFRPAKPDDAAPTAKVASAEEATPADAVPSGRQASRAAPSAAAAAPAAPPETRPHETRTAEVEQGRSYSYVVGLDPSGDNFLALKAGPDLRAGRLLKMGPGTPLTVLGRSGPWARVRLDTGQVGWAFSRYIACCRRD